MNRPDFSNYLAHFTKNGAFCNAEQDKQVSEIAKMSALERLISMLQQKKIFATSMPWTNSSCVCFTECPWSSLIAHTVRYSSYGIGFTKNFIFNKNGGPALYLRANIFNKYRKNKNKSKEEEELWTFVTPFAPQYRNSYLRKIIKCVDYTHEREWRVPKDLSFEYSNIAFIVVKTLSDYETLPDELQKSLDEANVKILIMDNYKLVEELWPVHIK